MALLPVKELIRVKSGYVVYSLQSSQLMLTIAGR